MEFFFLMIFPVAVFVGFGALLVWLTGFFTFAPFYEETALFKTDGRFRISDVIVLAVHIQILAGTFSALGGFPDGIPAFLVSSLVLLFWWICAIRMLARGGVNSSFDRWKFMGLMVPFGYIAGFFAIIGILAIPLAMISFVFMRENGDSVGALITIIACGSSYLLIFGIRVVGKQICEKARKERAERDGIEFVAAVAPVPISFVDDQGRGEISFVEHNPTNEGDE